MPEEKRTATEKFYQAVYQQAQAARVPTFGICAGAQHLVLSRGGALKKSITRNSDIELEPFHVPHFMSLSAEGRKQVLERCEAIQVKIDVFRAHGYAAVKAKMGDLILASTAEGITPMAYYLGFENIATQFHPEARYQGVSAYGDSASQAYQTRLLNSFFELCMQHNTFVQWAKEKVKHREEALDLRDSMNRRILERLRACREDAAHTIKKDWVGEVDFKMIRPESFDLG
jgi:GMP synthase-like glutamine amidotransferase